MGSRIAIFALVTMVTLAGGRATESAVRGRAGRDSAAGVSRSESAAGTLSVTATPEPGLPRGPRVGPAHVEFSTEEEEGDESFDFDCLIRATRLLSPWEARSASGVVAGWGGACVMDCRRNTVSAAEPNRERGSARLSPLGRDHRYREWSPPPRRVLESQGMTRR